MSDGFSYTWVCTPLLCDTAIAQGDNVMRKAFPARIVRDHNDCPALFLGQPKQDLGNLLSRLRIERCRGLVGQKNGGIL